MNPEDKKRFRDRANQARRALLKEKDKYGYINDGAGKRYRAAVYYILGGANEQALEFYSWFESEFSDDIGEPLFNLFWALAEFRAGHEEQARYRLQLAMLSNLYMLPFLIHEPISPLDIWHSSNMDCLEYLREIEEFLAEPTDEERQWFRKEYHSQQFSALRNEYISVFHELDHERDFQKRGAILNKWREFLAQSVVAPLRP
jgi:hypothetical protein